MEKKKFTIEIEQAQIQSVKLKTQTGQITSAEVTVTYKGEDFTRTFTEIQPSLRKLCVLISQHVADYLGLDDPAAVTYTGHSYKGTDGEDDRAVILKYYYRGIDGGGVGQSLPKIVFAETNFKQAGILAMQLKSIDRDAFDLFAGWSAQMSLFTSVNNATEESADAVSADYRVQYASQGHEESKGQDQDHQDQGQDQGQNQDQDQDGEAEVQDQEEQQPAHVPAPAPASESKGKKKPAAIKGKPAFKVVEPDPSDDLPVSKADTVTADDHLAEVVAKAANE